MLSLTLFGLVLRLVRLDFQPLWWDEGYSAWFATHSLGQMAALTAEDIHPPLYYAVLHLWTLIAGPGPVSLRLVSVAAGTAAIPLMYAAGLRIFGTRRIALLAAFLLASNPLHIYYSQEVRMYGLVALLSTGVLWAAWGVLGGASAADSNRRMTPAPHTTERMARGSGLGYVVLTTLTLYTQYYAVFLPVGMTLYALWGWRRNGRGLVRWFVLQGIVAVLYLPWVIYAGPRLTLYVSQKVVQDADRPLGLAAYFARHLAAFAAGHLEGGLGTWWPLGLVVLVPVAWGLIRAWQRWDREHGVESQTALGANRPDMNVRATERRPMNGARPRDAMRFLAIVLLTALFLGWLIGLRYPFFPDRGERLLLLALPAFVMLAAAGLADLSGLRSRGRADLSGLANLTGLGLSLFVVVAALSLAFFYTVPRYPGDDYRPLIARTVEQGLPGDTVFCIYPWQVGYWRSYAATADGPTALLTPSVEWNPTLEAALDGALQRGHVWFPAHLALGGILETRTEQYLASQALPFANTWYGPGTRLSGWQAAGPSGTASVPFPGGAPLATYTAEGGELALAGAAAPAAAVPAANAVAPVSLAWEAPSRPNLAVSVRLVDDLGQIWAQNDYEPLGAMVGAAGEGETGGPWRAVDRFGLLVPVGVPPGRYHAELVVLPPKDTRPLMAQVPGRPPAASVRLFDVEVAAAGRALTPNRLPITHRKSIGLGDGLRFLGYTIDDAPLAPGSQRRVSLFWQAVGQPGSDWTAFVQLLGKDGAPVAGWEAPPGAAYPTSQWTAGTLIRTQAYFRPNAELADGGYALIAGLYRPSDGARMQTAKNSDSLALGSVQIRGRPVDTTPPAPRYRADGTFGSVARLLGYDSAPDNGQITLYWQALGSTERPYTVFVHVVDAQDQVLGYGDSEPGNGAYPTTGWREGEYLADGHKVEMARGTGLAGARVAVGLYDPSTGQRLLNENGQDAVTLDLPQ